MAQENPRHSILLIGGRARDTLERTRRCLRLILAIDITAVSERVKCLTGSAMHQILVRIRQMGLHRRLMRRLFLTPEDPVAPIHGPEVRKTICTKHLEAVIDLT
jgi:hypothetical protein